MATNTSNCPDFLDLLENRRCVEEFIKELPLEFRTNLATIIEIVNAYLDFEATLLSMLDQYYLILLSILDTEIALLQDAFSFILLPYEEIKKYWSRFQSCPGVALLGQYLEDSLRVLTGPLTEKLRRRNKIFDHLQRQGIRNADLMVKQLLIGENATIDNIQQFLWGFADCLQKGIPSINPPFTGAV